MFELNEQPCIGSLCLRFHFSNAVVYVFKHLRSKGREDDLFSDPCYQQFGEELNKVLKDWQPSVLPDGRYCLIITISTLILETAIVEMFAVFSPAFQRVNVLVLSVLVSCVR